MALCPDGRPRKERSQPNESAPRTDHAIYTQNGCIWQATPTTSPPNRPPHQEPQSHERDPQQVQEVFVNKKLTPSTPHNPLSNPPPSPPSQSTLSVCAKKNFQSLQLPLPFCYDIRPLSGSHLLEWAFKLFFLFAIDSSILTMYLI